MGTGIGSPSGEDKAKLIGGGLVLAALVAALFTNPDRTSLEEAWRENEGEPDVVENAFVEVSSSRTSLGVFSLGVVSSRVRLGGPELKRRAAVGVFGRWWFFSESE